MGVGGGCAGDKASSPNNLVCRLLNAYFYYYHSKSILKQYAFIHTPNCGSCWCRGVPQNFLDSPFSTCCFGFYVCLRCTWQNCIIAQQHSCSERKQHHFWRERKTTEIRIPSMLSVVKINDFKVCTRSMVYKERGFFETSPVPNFFRNLD